MFFEHIDMRWGYTFLQTSLHLPLEEMFVLMHYATEMYLLGEMKRDVKGPGYAGRITTKGEYKLVGALGGVQFDAYFDTDYGSDKMSFLVSEQTEREPEYSMN